MSAHPPQDDQYDDPEENREREVRLDAIGSSEERDIRPVAGDAGRIGLPFPVLFDGHERWHLETEAESSGDMRRADDGRALTLERDLKTA